MNTPENDTSQPTQEPLTVHLTLQGKGGVGKSFVSSVLHQYLAAKNETVLGMDTDPVNRTYSSYRSLNVGHIELIKDGDIDKRKFDELIDWTCTRDDGAGHKIIDTGASSFIPFASYLADNDVFGLFAERDIGFAVHVVIAGGQAYIDTLSGLDSIARMLSPEGLLYIWVNGGLGPVDKVEKTKAYDKHRDKITGMVNIPTKSDMWSSDMALMLSNRQTFVDAHQDPTIPLMSRRRLEIVQNEIYESIDLAGL